MRELAERLASLAYDEAQRKHIDITPYHQTLLVAFFSRADRNRKIWAIRFSPFKCGELGFDGGGFDSEFDYETYKLIDSYISYR